MVIIGLRIRAFALVTTLFNSRKYSFNILIFMHVVHIKYNTDHIVNGICRTNGLSTETYKIF